MSSQVFNGFWNGFEDPRSCPPTLCQTPPSVDTVTLAFAGPTADNRLSTNYLCKHYSPETIKGWARTLRERGTRVLMSLLDTPSVHWDSLDIPAFAKSAAETVIDEWGLDGIDVDSESGGATADTFKELVHELRTSLGPRGGPHLLTYDSYLFSDDDKEVLAACKNSLDWVNVMAYFLEYDYMIDRFTRYADLMGADRVTIGVKPGRGQGDQSTPLDEVVQLARYQPPSGTKRGMMLYALTLDTPYFTDAPQWTWTNAIAANSGR